MQKKKDSVSGVL